ncbi:flagellar hook-associated protein FlgK [Sphingomonas sp. PAMC 26605]|uniref:flagellar hook-associated protein FlgK n=1 Tax=Sphingomonas sp. PAMC 26605 TaxID=1112214 RepID=UPI00026CD07D|nr:flagellar hook-associated protein FlgK [Sphingomonas sp. PAMC 26605]
MSDLLSIGASGVKAYQTALTTVSENIANAATPGYAKRTADLREIGPSIGITTGSKTSVGQGVIAAGITRSADSLRAADVRNASADLARTDTSVEWLGRIQNALTGNQVGDQLTGFFNSAKSVAADPTASAPRAALLEQAKTVAGSFTATGKALDSLDADLDATATQAATTLTSLSASLAQINDGLARVQPGSNGAAQLADQRDSILDQISAISDLSVSIDSAGRATVKLGNAGGPTIVSGNQSASVAFARGSDGTVAFTVQSASGVTAATPSGGALAGIVEAAGRIADARTQLNGIATAFTSGVNAVQAQGSDLSGNTGAALFATGASPTDITVALTDPNGIAAAAKGASVRDNSNLANLATLRTTGAFETRTTALISGNAATLASRQQVATAQGSIRDTAVAARDAVSGVNLDSEAVDLLRFQQAYSASSRVIQVARDTLQSILDIR